MSRRTSLYTLALSALVAWGGLLVFTRFVYPGTTLDFAVFFALLCVALTCTCGSIIYMSGHYIFAGRLYRATIRPAIRQGALLSLIIVLNLMLHALHSWNIFTAIVICLVAIVVEILALARK